MSDTEEWKPVVGYEGTYDVSGRGVRRIAAGGSTYIGRILKQSLDTHGCPCVTLCLRGKQTTCSVAHLVADAFLPAKGPTDEVLRHLNDDPADNRPCNLAWGTYSDNLNDAVRNGRLHPKGESHYRAKLTEDDVREIRRLYATGNFSYQELALKFGVVKTTIIDIVRRKTWKHI